MTQVDVFKTYTVTEALSVNMPNSVLQNVSDKIALARDLSQQMVPGMTEFQIKQFVLGDITDRVTPYGVYQQTLREIGTRYQAILEAQYKYEKDQASLAKFLALKGKAAAKLLTEDDEVVEAEILEYDAEINHILRSLPAAEVQLNDTVKQLGYYIEVWKSVENKIDHSLSEYEMQRIEWEARVIMRYFKGRLNYVPTQFDNAFLSDCLELALDMREYGFTDTEAADVAGRSNNGLRRDRMTEIINTTCRGKQEVILPLSSHDELTGLLAQRRAAFIATQQRLQKRT